MINNNINKFTNKKKPEISAQLNHYVNNLNYKNNLEYVEYKKKKNKKTQSNIDKDLLSQMRDKDNRKRFEIKKENREEQRKFNINQNTN